MQLKETFIHKHHLHDVLQKKCYTFINRASHVCHSRDTGRQIKKGGVIHMAKKKKKAMKKVAKRRKAAPKKRKAAKRRR
jgi:hypothetical protein